MYDYFVWVGIQSINNNDSCIVDRQVQKKKWPQLISHLGEIENTWINNYDKQTYNTHMRTLAMWYKVWYKIYTYK